MCASAHACDCVDALTGARMRCRRRLLRSIAPCIQQSVKRSLSLSVTDNGGSGQSNSSNTGMAVGSDDLGFGSGEVLTSNGSKVHCSENFVG